MEKSLMDTPRDKHPAPAYGTSSSSGAPMKLPAEKSSRKLLRYLILGVVLLAAGAGAAVLAIYGMPDIPFFGKQPTVPTSAPAKKLLAVEVVEGTPHTLSVPEPVRKALGIGNSLVVQEATQTRPLILPGSTALDPTRLMRIRTRFNAEVVDIGQVAENPLQSGSGQTVTRELQTGDRVKKGDLLAVVWSVDVGSKKSDLVDAIVQLRLDEERLKARIELWKNGNLPDDTLNQTRRDVVTDQNTADRAERTLRTWNVPEREIQVAREEAEEASRRKGQRDKEKERLWARSELIAPRDGTIVERNVGKGEYIADNTINLFTIADVDRLLVVANPPEDYLPTLLSLKPEERKWSLQMVGAPALTGRIEEIGYILDANQHTAVVKGHIDNPDGRLRAGQFVSATIALAPPPDVVEVPLTALAEDGKQSFVFVQPDPAKPHYTMRRVQVTLRFEKTAFVRSNLKPEEERLTPEETAQGLQPRQPLKPGEQVLTSGVLELRAALEDRESKAKKNR
jgi:cobalt-zinc-cadmium efflux system membrane fusion protein